MLLSDKVKKDDIIMMEMLDEINLFRNNKSYLVQKLSLCGDKPHQSESLRRKLMTEFTFMAKL